MTKSIREYQSADADAVKAIFIQKSRRTEFKRVAKAVFYHKTARRTWQAGIVGLLSLQLRLMLTHRKSALAMCLWSAGVGLGWFFWLRSQDRKRVSKEYSTMVDRFREIQHTSTDITSDKKNHVWVMEDDTTGPLDQKVVVGVVGFQYDEDDQEGRIWNPTGIEPRIELALVKTAIQFARDHQINVLTQVVSSASTTYSKQ
ncbi:hypothetical protein BX666DRAFT_2028773 [Dichotomocladium elegans]|nr:hypothetical protein BX666DRAFT_2028773 [Dichotomocladium elegans]